MAPATEDWRRLRFEGAEAVARAVRAFAETGAGVVVYVEGEYRDFFPLRSRSRRSTLGLEAAKILCMGSERVRKVLALAEQLDPEERAELADELWSTLPESMRGDDELEKEELERRLDDVHAGRDTGVAWGGSARRDSAELA